MGHYTHALMENHIHVGHREDSLERIKKGGIYLPKVGYQVIRSFEYINQVKWWHQDIWDIHFPLKAKPFLWICLTDCIPTWYNILRRFEVSPTDVLYAVRTVNLLIIYSSDVPLSSKCGHMPAILQTYKSIGKEWNYRMHSIYDSLILYS